MKGAVFIWWPHIFSTSGDPFFICLKTPFPSSKYPAFSRDESVRPQQSSLWVWEKYRAWEERETGTGLLLCRCKLECCHLFWTRCGDHRQLQQQQWSNRALCPLWSHWMHGAGFRKKIQFLEWEDGTSKMLLVCDRWPFRSCVRHFSSELLAAESPGSSRAEAGVCSVEQQIWPNTCAELLSTSGTPVPWAGGEGGQWLCRPWRRLTARGVRNARKWGGLEMQARYLTTPSEYVALEIIPLSPKCKKMITSCSSSHSPVRHGVAVCGHTGLSRPCASPLSSLRAKQAVRSCQSARFSFIWHFNVKKNKMKHDAVGRALCAGLPETICIELKSQWLVV